MVAYVLRKCDRDGCVHHMQVQHTNDSNIITHVNTHPRQNITIFTEIARGL